MSEPRIYYQDASSVLYQGDCRDVLPRIASGSVDLVLTDPPYPYVKREYGYWTEDEWWALMRPVVAECRRVLKPSGSAVFILQPNGERIGRMRPWLWDFMAWCCREWNMVQDAWWWNYTLLPSGGATAHGLLRGTVKACIWLGASDCHRNQVAVLWTESDRATAQRMAARAGKAAKRKFPSGMQYDLARFYDASERRGGVTPFNLLPIPNADSANSGGAKGHPAATPQQLCEWWIKYLCPEGGTVLDTFAGSGTVSKAAKRLGRHSIAIEIRPDYCDVAASRAPQQMLPLEVA